VPWAALLVEGRHLCHLASIALTPSLRTLPTPNGAPADGLIALLDPLLQTHEETASSLGSLYPSAAILNEPSQLKSALRRSDAPASPGTCYVTCHGDSRPGLAHGLRLESGEIALTAAEMLGLRIPAHLHMGACSSGHVAEGREPIGLATVALSRGAQYVTAACWPISQAGAPRMTRIYHQYLRAGLGPPEALRRTQVEMSTARADVPLWDWAPYVVMGSP